jgi:hypothetical protein
MGSLQASQVRPNQLAKEIELNVADDPIADAIDEKRLQGLSQASSQGQGDDEKRYSAECIGARMHDEVVHRRLEDLEQQAREHGESDGAED